MAKDAHDREDLLRDATGYVQRVELRVEGVKPEIFCGFREQGAFSLYWGQDEVFQFNADWALRRGYWQSRMIASYLHQLHWLNRDATEARAKLSREAFSNDQQAEFGQNLATRLRLLKRAIDEGTYEVLGQVPPDEQIIARLRGWLGRLDCNQLVLAKHPGVGRS